MPKGDSVLIVEDEGIVARDLRYRLETMGYKVAGMAATGDEAVLKAWEHRPDLVLMDIVLKGDLDGIEAALMMRERADIPVVYLTAYADEETVQRTEASGPFGYLVKPFEDRELEACIEVALFKHRSEREIRASEVRFRSTVELAQDAVLIADSKRRLVMWNRGAERMFGYRPEEVLGTPLENMLSERDAQAFREGLARLSPGVAAPPQTGLSERSAIRKDGSEFPVEYSAAAWDAEGKRFYGIIIRDITERKLAERALAESEKQYRTLVTSLQEGVAMTDAEGRLVYVNPAFCEMLGYAKEELPGRSIASLARPGDGTLASAQEELSRRGQKEQFELRMVRKGGEERDIQVSSARWTDDSGAFLGTISAMTDVTDRRRAHKELQEKTDFLEAVLDAASDGVFVMDGDGNYVLMNNAAAELIGEPSEKWKERHAYDPLHPGEPGTGRSHIQRALSGEPSRFETRPDPGSDRVLAISLTPMSFSGKVHILGVVSDMTERRRAERLQRERARAELYGFMVSALPVFAASVPPQARDILVSSFAARFERIIRPRFEQELAALRRGGKAVRPDSPEMLNRYLSWISELYSNLGIETTVERGRRAGSLQFSNCPWVNEARGNPIFCLICRAIAIRSFTWAAPLGHASQRSSIVGGAACCHFDFQLPAA
ncbi:MAG: PAS domain S-box protein [Euryarchaeota archaeon]|nr:PAS domain S-box protein [Euryarchaeota archaeon]